MLIGSMLHFTALDARPVARRPALSADGPHAS
jgi:hypothetical protein